MPSDVLSVRKGDGRRRRSGDVPRLAHKLRWMRHVLETVKEADACMEVVRTYVSEGECGKVESRQAGTDSRGNLSRI